TVAACPAGTRIVLTYNLSPSTLDGMGLGSQNVLAQIAAEKREPFASMFEPAEAEDLMRRTGFVDIAHFGPEEAILTYVAGRDDVRMHSAQRLILAKVGRQGA